MNGPPTAGPPSPAWRRWRSLLALAALTALMLGCPDLNTVDTSVVIWQGTLLPDQAHPGLSGQVGAVTQAGGTDVGIGISGASPGAIHVWGLWLGSCAAPGTLVGTADTYPVLAVTDTGDATAETHLGALLATDSTYHAEVRASQTDSSRIACGNLLQQ